MTIDTATLRALADTYTEAPGIVIPQSTLRALCDGYDEAQRLRQLVDAKQAWIEAVWDEKAQLTTIVVQQRERCAALVADLRALCDEARVTISAGCCCPGDGECGCSGRPLGWSLDPTDLRAVIDRHAPEGDA